MRRPVKASIAAFAALLPLVLALTACTSAPASPAFGGVSVPSRTGMGTMADRDPAAAGPDSGEGGAALPGTEAAAAPEGLASPTAAEAAAETGEGLGTASPDRTIDGGLPETYRIRPGDVVSISVFREPSLNQEARVDADGTINMPLVRQVHVEGMTKYDAEQAIAAMYADGYLKNPIITVEIMPQGSAIAEGMVRILGEVRRPGLYPVPPAGTLSLLNALTAAGGVTEVASRNRIQITRISNDGRRQTLRASFDRIVDGTDPDLELLPNDIVRVPTGWW